jgi:hypothetical protein
MVLTWAIQVYALGLCIFVLFNFAAVGTMRHSALIYGFLAAQPLLALYGFILFPLAIFKFAQDLYLLTFQFESSICRSDGDFFDFFGFDQIAFSGAVYALIVLANLYRSQTKGRSTKPIVIWAVSLLTSALLIFLSGHYLPGSMADCFR